jgi:hypothetical protein
LKTTLHPGSTRTATSGIAVALFLACCFLMLVTGAFEFNFAVSALSAGTLLFGLLILWRPGESQILAFLFGYHWLQASTGIFLATFAGQPLNAYYLDQAPVEEATMLTLVALCAMVIGLRAVVGPLQPRSATLAYQQASSRSLRTWFIYYAIAFVGGELARLGTNVAPGLSQVFEGFANIRWAFFFILAVAHFRQKKNTGIWFPAAFAFEFATGLGGFFSDFKTVFIFTLLAMLSAKVSFSPSRLIGLVTIAAMALGLAVIWTAIKSDYRSYVNGGERTQSVNVGYVEQMQKIGELTLALEAEDLGLGVDNLMKRLSYVEFFGYTIERVPAQLEHENGAILWDAATRPFMPRILFPEKTVINDSDRTNLYTGLNMAGAEEGTSISLGWIAELYIDFGAWGMMLAAMLIGVFYGAIYRFLTSWSKSQGLLGFATATVVLFGAVYLESSITKVIGGVVVSLLAVLVITYVLGPRLFARGSRTSRPMQAASAPGL